MKKRYTNKKNGFRVLAVLKIVIVVIAAFGAIKVGIAGGNLLYSSDEKLIQSIDVQNYRYALSNSLPIINTIYNSGKSSHSLSGQLKVFLNGIFHFDLNSPITILNAQSPLFHSYYSNDYKKLLAERNSNNEPRFNFSELVKEDDKTNQYADPVISSIYIDEMEEHNVDDDDAVSYGKIAISNQTKYKIEIEELMKDPVRFDLSKKGPKVLIFHTHTTESYIKDISQLDKKGVDSRSSDNTKNIVRVGEELAQILRKDYNIEVIHNAAVHDYPGTSGAYGRSLNTVGNILKSYPSIKIVLDIHRDALKDKMLRVVTEVDSKKAARVMFVMGSDSRGLAHPNWRENLKLAVALQQKLNEKYPGLTRPILISTNRYNQHLSDGALIVEVGGNGNTLSESIESVKYLAEVINEVVNNK